MRRRRWRRRHQRWQASPHTLADVRPGDQVRIVGLEGLSEASRSMLQALGLCPGRYVEVIRHSPVTLVRVEHSELALEAETARRIRVQSEGPHLSTP